MPNDLTADQALRLREFFAANEYTEQGLRDTLGSAIPPPQTARPKAFYLTREATPLSILLRLFFLDEPVSDRIALECLPEWFVDLCLEIDLLIEDGDTVVSKVMIAPLAEFLFASDRLWNSQTDSSDFVLPATSRTARYMLDFSLRKGAKTTLDLGTGCGVLAHFASLHSDHVIATDINPHATEFAAFNAKLNGRDNIECRTGDLFSPVKDHRFDLILTNPPFVLAPSRQFIYRDNDMLLDEFCRMLAKTAPGFLQDRGCFQMICEWVEAGDEPWHERLGGWFENTGCDAWVLHAAPQDPTAYAQIRVTEVTEHAIERDIASYAEWMKYYRANDVRAIYSGVITMRRREGANWIRFQALSDRVEGPVHQALEDGFAARDSLDSLSAEEALECLTPSVAPDAVLEQTHKWSTDKWLPSEMTIRLATGLSDEVQLDQGAVEFLTQFDGTRTIAECIKNLAEAREEAIEEAQKKYLPIVRAMIERGFLLILN